eukprot:CAMPEP_0180611526 /NCGR_PEP_ID=MMETSP1037_2-20121125/29857_1 /TAXON_ID=632150 /ORGANISM="Azadinium spinosum, Strain 3D9" /LENGTH=46 /DNA_ID= /DNA_START= /DNA_END= /DNA_ORIENTATION=
MSRLQAMCRVLIRSPGVEVGIEHSSADACSDLGDQKHEALLPVALA